MAEPFAVIGLAASILTFVDFGVKVIALAKSIRESQDGAIPEAEELESIVEDVRAFSASIRETSGANELNRDEQRVLSISAKCGKLATELGDVLKKLRVRDKAWSKKIDTTRVIIQAMWKKKDIDSLRDRLGHLERSLRESLNHTLQQSVFISTSPVSSSIDTSVTAWVDSFIPPFFLS